MKVTAQALTLCCDYILIELSAHDTVEQDWFVIVPEKFIIRHITFLSKIRHVATYLACITS